MAPAGLLPFGHNTAGTTCLGIRFTIFSPGLNNKPARPMVKLLLPVHHQMGWQLHKIVSVMFLSSFAPLWDPEINFFTDPDFDGFRHTLDGVMKELQGKGVGVNRKQAEPILPEEEEQMWKTRVLGAHIPQSLLDTMWIVLSSQWAGTS